MELIDSVEARVLGALIEKEAATPEYYPLSLNALINACNQKSNRFPTVEFDEDTVLDALERLKRKHFAAVIVGGSRVHKYAQRFSETLNLGRRELAILCVLLLRGPQTLGEIRDRSERMFSFADLDEAERVLEKLAEFQGGSLARKLPRQPGQKEARYTQLLTGEPAAEPEIANVADAAPASRLSQVESELAALKAQVAELQRRFDALGL